MEDREIVDLYFARSEEAIRYSKNKYGDYCFCIADRILNSKEDAEEALDDTWLRAWNSIPPQRPAHLRQFFAKITRNLALDRCRRRDAQKRGGSFALAYEELSECLASGQTPEEVVSADELEDAIRRFLGCCGETERNVFLRRYFYFDSTKEIASRYSMRESNILNILSRARKKLEHFLKEEGLIS